jgi:hypothetical protein
MSDGLSSWPDAERDVAARAGQQSKRQDQAVAAVRREAIRFRLAALAAVLVYAIGGLILKNAIPFVPTFPLVLMIAAVICVTAAIRAGQLEPRLRGAGGAVAYLGGLLYTAVIGPVVILVFSLIGTIGGAIPTAAPHGGPKHIDAALLNLSWPTVVICIISLVLALRIRRRIRGA